MVEGIGKILRTMLDKTRERMIMVCYHWGRRKGFVYRLSNDRRKIEGFDAFKRFEISGVVDSTKFSLGSCHDYNRRTDEEGKEKEYVEE